MSAYMAKPQFPRWFRKIGVGCIFLFQIGLRLSAGTVTVAAAEKEPANAKSQPDSAQELESGFVNPVGKTWIYWWWPNGYASNEGIVRDLDEMKTKGISGALVFHAGAGETPVTIEFMSKEWLEFFRFAVEEAAKRDITITLNLCQAWNALGPWITPDHAARMLHTQTLQVNGPQALSHRFPVPEKLNYYEALFALAWREKEGVCQTDSWIDLTGRLKNSGHLEWQIPDGQWRIVLYGSHVHSKAKRQRGLETDPLNKAAMDVHFEHTVLPAIKGLEPYLGKTFTHVHIDSSEIGNPDWTPKFREEFRRLRGYDPFPYLAAKANLVVNDTETTERFLEDYDRTVGDLMIECYYGYLGELAAKYGLKTHSEAAGFQKPTVDALRALGCNDISMSEFWARFFKDGRPAINQMSEPQLRAHDGIKTAASAAHVYGRPIVQAEAYTVSIKDPNFHADLFDLKDVGDRAFCQGLNRMVLCFFILQPESDDRMPGYLWPGVGYEFNRKTTWWPMSKTWFDYLNRCQYLHQEGRAVADVCYFQGDWVPAYVPAKWAMDPPLPAGYDCDTINAEAMINRMKVDGQGRLCLPDGFTYRYLVLNQAGRWQKSVAITNVPEIGSGKPLALSLASLRKLKELAEAGATVMGPKPDRMIGLPHNPQDEAEARELIEILWDGFPALNSAPVVTIRSSSSLIHKGNHFTVERAADGNPKTFWVSKGVEPGEGPTKEKPEWLLLDLGKLRPVTAVTIVPRVNFGPRAAELQISEDGSRFETVQQLSMDRENPVTVELSGRATRSVRLLITDSWANERNVQVCEFSADCPNEAPVSGETRVGKGRVIWNRSLADVMRADGLLPDLEIQEGKQTLALPIETFGGIPNPGSFDWIHRTVGTADFYFLTNLRNAPASGDFVFRVNGKQPELWDPITGTIQKLPAYGLCNDGRISLPLEFSPRQCFFVVFRNELQAPGRGANFPDLRSIGEVAGSWEVRFNTKWGGPESIVFDQLQDWTDRPEEGIKYYSGTATYRKTFDLPETAADGRLYLDLGVVNDMACVRLNGSDMGIVWCAPWRVDITAAVKPTGNRLEIDVVNLWRNRLVGDVRLPPDQRFTTSNLEKIFKPDTPLLPSGLRGPVTLKSVR